MHKFGIDAASAAYHKQAPHFRNRSGLREEDQETLKDVIDLQTVLHGN